MSFMENRAFAIISKNAFNMTNNRLILVMLFITSALVFCKGQLYKKDNMVISKIAEIPLPKGFERIVVDKESFGDWLRNFPLSKDNTVYLYDGSAKANQQLHYAVLDISVGKNDLQQCADSIVRLKAEYHFSIKEYGKINFVAGKKNTYNFSVYAKKKQCFTHDCLMVFLQEVFINYGTYNLEEQLKPIVNYATMSVGDVFVKGGGPGHAMMVADVAINKITGQKIYLLLQSFMPAQSVHVVVNPTNPHLSPWYIANETTITTPGWVFYKSQLKRW